jgi:hypothetical protein
MSQAHDSDSEAPPATAGAQRKLYAAPALRVYGDVAELTRTSGNGSMVADGGSMAFSKTA